MSNYKTTSGNISTGKIQHFGLNPVHSTVAKYFKLVSGDQIQYSKVENRDLEITLCLKRDF